MKQQVETYRRPQFKKSSIKVNESVEGETIETKVMRIVDNNEPITDGAPEIFTERKDGVVSAYNIRTDRWEIAADAMNAVNKSKIAQAEGIGQEAEKTTKEKEKTGQETREKDGGAEPIQGQGGDE